MAKERQSGYELLRLILMLMIVAQHVINNGILAVTGSGDYPISVPAGSFGTFLEVAVNSFVLISGYFGMRLNIKRIIRLVLDMVVIGAGVYIVSVITGYREFAVADAIYSVIPIHWWFIIYYIVLMLFVPYLNMLIDVLDKKQYICLLVTMFFALSIAPTFLGYDFGGGISNFIFMYFIGRYFRLHTAKRVKGYIYFIGYIVFILFSIAGDWYLHSGCGIPYTWHIKFFQSNSVFIVCASVCFFASFLRIDFKSNVVNTLAKSTLGIYIIHEHPIVRSFYLEKFDVLSYVNQDFCAWFVNFLVTSVVVYIVCLIIESVRLLVFDRINDRLCDILANTKVARLFNI